MKLRRAAPLDIARIAAIEAAAFPDPWSLVMLQDAYENPAVTAWVADVGGELAGYLFYMACGDEGELLNVAVAPTHQRRGIGGALVQTMCAYARGIGAQQVFLEVRRSNVSAQQLYERYGFTKVGVRPRYYRTPPEDALVWRWVVK